MWDSSSAAAGATEAVPHVLVGCVGAGPANLSFAALGEQVLDGSVMLFDRQAGPAWHPGLLGNGARLQTSWIKDLVTLVDPCNRFSFLNYLVRTGRIYAFLNAQFTAIPRLEYARYLAWAAQELGTVRYGAEITEVEFDGDRFMLTTADGPIATADHVVFGLGTRPAVPAFAGQLGRDVLLADELTEHLARGRHSRSEQVIVVGGGQTGAESVLALVSHGFREIRWIGRRHWFAPLDDSPPANDFYRPTYLRFFSQLPDALRRSYAAEQVLTSDGVSMETLQEIYRLNYEAFLRDGRAPVMMLPGRDAVKLSRGGGTLTLWCRRGWGGSERHTARLIVLAAGRHEAPLPLGPRLAEQVELDSDGQPVVEQDYSLRGKHDPNHRLFVQNRSRLRHGVADPNLSLLPVRSAQILNSLLDRSAYPIRDEQVYTMWS